MARGVQELTQDVAADSYVAFHTRELTVQLLDNTGALFGDGYSVTYYWPAEAEEVFGSTASGQVSKELLAPGAGHYYFRIADTISSTVTLQDVSIDPLVTFQTGKVTQGQDTCLSIGCDGAPIQWPFVEPMQMLPGIYTFQMDKKGCVAYEVGPGQTVNLQNGKYTTP